jgi:hypothetical protein
VGTTATDPLSLVCRHAHRKCDLAIWRADGKDDRVTGSDVSGNSMLLELVAHQAPARVVLDAWSRTLVHAAPSVKEVQHALADDAITNCRDGHALLALLAE